MFNSAIIKLTSYCNLNCTYCYMFNLEDKSYLRMPKNMHLRVIEVFLQKLQAYLDSNGQKSFKLILHGGEPTLWPIDSYRFLLEAVRSLNSAGYDISIGLQTNLFKVDWSLIELLSAYDVTLSVSLDGPREINDRHRITFGGKGSYQVIIRNLNELIARGYRHLIGGVLTVADVGGDVEEYLDWIESLPIRVVDVLWPQEFSHDNPPWKGGAFADYKDAPVFGSWFLELFHAWIARDNPDIIIRLFYHTISCMYGGKQHIDFLINDSINTFCLDTDGGLNYHDYFRASGDGTVVSGLNIARNTIADLSTDPIFNYLLNLKHHLPAACRSCKHKAICGGGFLPGRFKKGDPLPRHQSILCADQYHFFEGITRYLDQIDFRSSITYPGEKAENPDKRVSIPAAEKGI